MLFKILFVLYRGFAPGNGRQFGNDMSFGKQFTSTHFPSFRSMTLGALCRRTGWSDHFPLLLAEFGGVLST
jgi:hypothetical protein